MRIILFLFNAFVGLTTCILGLLLTASPPGTTMGLTVLHSQPSSLTSFFQGLLLTGIGIINLRAAFSSTQADSNQYNWALAGGLGVSLLIVGQFMLSTPFHWLQLIYLLGGVLIILLSYQLKGKWAA